ncbi:hypothetical protein ACFWMS_05645 [Peribacillus butanolivorans]|uniref:hypothetical protein n=1 Tax=Peribacillus butanolivorans TaxID=421767 RepID=UPI0036604755
MNPEEIRGKLKAEYDRKSPLKEFEFVLPIKVENDCDYENTLNDVLDKYLICIEGKVDITVYKKTENNVSLIKEAIKYYYNANISKAKEAINNVLESYMSNNYIVSSLDDSPALRGITRLLSNPIIDKLANAPLSFFKARSGKKIYSREEFLHIPFNKRGIVATQRYSIAGVPCMYFGASSYVCWLELGKPDNEEFTISSYQIPKDIKILNLAITQGLVNGFSQQNHDSLIEFFPLVIATSFSVSEDKRQFKSEYIISQLIMQSLASFGIDGVAYVSKKIEHNNPSIQTGNENFPSCVNLAIPMKNDNKEDYSTFAIDIRLTEPINFKEYLDSTPYPCGNKISYANLFEYSTVTHNGKEVNYTSLPYSRLDNYLVNLDHRNYNNK